MKKKILAVFIALEICTLGLSACSQNRAETNDDALEAYYKAADFNKTVNLTTQSRFTSEESSSSTVSGSLVKICGNEMTFTTDSVVKASSEDDDITNSISSYIYNDTIYYDVNGSKLKEECTVKNAVYMLGLDFALFDKSYCDSIDFSYDNGKLTTTYEMNPDMVLLNWENTFFNLYYGLGIVSSQIQTIDHCTITVATEDDKIISYAIDFLGDIQDGEGSVTAEYNVNMEFSDYGNTVVTPFENLDEYVDSSQTGEESGYSDEYTEDFSETDEQ